MEKPGMLERAAEALRAGGVVAFPTETVYGLGAAVFNEKAVARIFEVKRRPFFDPLIVHISKPGQLGMLVEGGLSRTVCRLMELFWPGPLTIVLPRKGSVPDIVTSGLPTVAVRMPRHPLALELIEAAGVPLAAPSANLFGRPSPTTAGHVVEQLAGGIDCVLDGGPCPVGVESTIVSFAGGSPVLLRPGGVPVEDIEAVTGRLEMAAVRRGEAVAAPGMLAVHYAPRTPLRLLEEGRTAGAGLDSGPGCRAGLIAFMQPPAGISFEAVEVLSGNGDLREAASRLFSAIRRLDGLGLDVIYAQTVPDRGLGLAINDRLARAAAAGQGGDGAQR